MHIDIYLPRHMQKKVTENTPAPGSAHYPNTTSIL
jgi:hypothetical protein